ncbi:replication/maintenance protein RepL [Neobacillus sp. 19]|uniref:replication/maintenance protein RepL n=1 Tax=Neobacillus sp. 19 TaxID=3394458 RepID=UPI003BF6A6E9
MARRRENHYFWGSFVLEWFHHLRDSNFVASDYRVLFYLCEEMKGDDNTAYIKQKEIAAKLHMDKGNVSKSITRLREKQFIVKVQNGYMINPHLFYVGKRKDGRESLRETFDETLEENGVKTIFYLNEDEHALEVNEE